MSVSRETRLHGVSVLARWRLRQDAVWWTLWCLGLALEPLAVAQTYTSAYPTPAARESLQRTSENNPGLNLLYGQPLDLTSAGGFVTWRILSFLLVLAGIAGALRVIRHLRGDEEDGRSELLRSAPVGVSADLVAVMVSLTTGALAVTALTSIGLVAWGLPPAGSLTMGAAMGCSLLVWGACAAVAAQVVDSARTARMIVMGLLAAGFLLRGVADASPASSLAHQLGWATPLGWIAAAHPFVDDGWGVPAVTVVVALALMVGAGLLQGRRDLGQGFVGTGVGRPRAHACLRSPLALVMRLTLVPSIVWTVALVVGGAMLGAIAPSIADLVGDTPGNADIIRSMGGQSGLVDAYFSAILPILALLAAVFALSIIGQMAAAESSGAAELILATPTSRARWAMAHVAWALVMPALTVLGAGLSAGVSARVSGGASMPGVGAVVAGAAVAVPGLWVVTAAAFGLWALTGRMGPPWAAFGVVMLIVWLGAALRLPQWVMNVSPFAHLPHLPGGTLDVLPIVGCVLVTIGGIAAGLVAQRQP